MGSYQEEINVSNSVTKVTVRPVSFPRLNECLDLSIDLSFAVLVPKTAVRPLENSLLIRLPSYGMLYDFFEGRGTPVNTNSNIGILC